MGLKGRMVREYREHSHSDMQLLFHSACEGRLEAQAVVGERLSSNRKEGKGNWRLQGVKLYPGAL